MRLLADDVKVGLRHLGPDQRQHGVGKPEDGIHVRAIVHLPGENQGVGAEVGRRQLAAGMVERQVNSVRHDGDLKAGDEPPQSAAVGLGHGHDPICRPASQPLVTHQLAPLHQRVGRAQPAARPADVRQKGPLLQQILGVMIIEDQPRLRPGPESGPGLKSGST